MSNFKTILVVVDSFVERHAELERAIKLCDQTEVKLHLIGVVKDVSWTVRLLSKDYAHIHELLVQEKVTGLNRLVDHCQSHGVTATGEVLEGLSSQVTLDTAHRIGADLIIQAAKGERSLAQGTLGSSAQRLIRRLPCSIWLTRPTHEPEYQLIVAAVDATPNDSAHAHLNRRILETALELAKRERCKLLVTYAWSLYGSEMLSHRLPASEYEVLMDHNRRQHVDSFEALLSEFDLHATGPDARMIQGEPSSAIPELCEKEKANLLVCGTVARHGLAGLLLGNTAERILNRATCSVLAIAPPVV